MSEQSLITIWPFPGQYRITSGVGPREYYIDGQKYSDLHKGWDIAMPVGCEIIAPEVCTIRAASYANDLGHFMVLDGIFYRWNLWHLSEQIKTAGLVIAGEIIAKSGGSGRSTGPHCHMQIAKRSQKMKEFVDPGGVFHPAILALLNLGG